MNAPADSPLDPQPTSPAARGDAGVPLLPRSVQWALTLLLTIGFLGLVGASVLHGSRADTSTPTPSGRIDLNRATTSELLLLPGVGPQLAQRIDQHRRDHGSFKTVDDLRKVPGVGPALLERLRPRAIAGAPEAEVKTPAANPLVEPPASKPTKVQSLTAPIDINTADLKELQKLPGIGPKLSQRIVDERLRKSFQSVQDLRRVPGIGPKTLEKIKPYIKV